MSKGLSPADPKVTVFMAVYNREAVVGDAVRSVLAQTFRAIRAENVGVQDAAFSGRS